MSASRRTPETWRRVRHLHLVQGVPMVTIARRLSMRPETVRWAVQTNVPPAARCTPILSEREADVLRLAACGLSQCAIGARLGIHKSTVYNHLNRVRAKLGAVSTVEAIAMARRLGALNEVREAA